MNKQKLVRRPWAIATVALPGVLLSTSIALADARGVGNKVATPPVGSMGPVPKAQCGPGIGPKADCRVRPRIGNALSGDSEGGYNCNLELVGQFRGEGTFSQDGPAYYDHCAYMGTENNPLQQHPGVVVIDVSDPTNPGPTAYLDDTPAGLNPHET